MPRREIPLLPDLYYHFYNRGNNRQPIFFQPENYLFFLRRFKEYVLPFVDVLVYCLMPTHYHILVKVKQQTSEVLETSDVSKQVSLAMQKFLISYAKAINRRFSRIGSLFQGQFQAKPVKTEAHLQNLCIYIHANPVKDGLVTAPRDWIYSNYLEWLGQRGSELVDRDFIQEHFRTSAEYRTLVEQFLKTRYLPDDVREYLDRLER